MCLDPWQTCLVLPPSLLCGLWPVLEQFMSVLGCSLLLGRWLLRLGCFHDSIQTVLATLFLDYYANENENELGFRGVWSSWSEQSVTQNCFSGLRLQLA